MSAIIINDMFRVMNPWRLWAERIEQEDADFPWNHSAPSRRMKMAIAEIRWNIANVPELE